MCQAGVRSQRDSMWRMRLRPIDATDWPAVLRMNEASVDFVTPLESDALGWLVGHAYRSIVVQVAREVSEEEANELAAFAIVLPHGAAYQSPNYRWFSERYEQFAYLDRIVVAERWRRRGVGTLVYDAMEEVSAPVGRLLCEVDLVPPNLPSLGFHTARGYQEVGHRANERGKVLAMLAKELRPRCS